MTLILSAHRRLDQVVCASRRLTDNAEVTYINPPTSTQQSPSVQPVVTSPRTFFQSSNKLGSGCWPATKVVKTMSTSAAP